MTNKSELLRPFAQAILAKALALRKLELTKSQRARLLESVSDDIKKCTNFVVPKASRRALKEAKKQGIDLCTKCWHDQTRFDKGRKIYHLEHFHPVSSIRAECLKADTESKIFNVLDKKLRVVWLLKKENDRLTALGFRNKRPKPSEAYRHAKIEIAK